MKTAKTMTAQEMANVSVKVRKAKAAERFRKVRELRDQGLSAPKILETLNADGANWKIRTIYEDFKKIKQVDARAPEKMARWLKQVNYMSKTYYTLSECIRHINSYGFTIDAKKVTNYAELEKEVEKSINADIHDNIGRVS